MFQFSRFASWPYGFRPGYRSRGGLPHSEIPGSKSARLSPGLIAACHVLHRLSAPRHPPDALLILAFLRRIRRNPDPARRAQGQAPDRRSREDTIYRIETEASPPEPPHPPREESGQPRSAKTLLPSRSLCSLFTLSKNRPRRLSRRGNTMLHPIVSRRPRPQGPEAGIPLSAQLALRLSLAMPRPAAVAVVEVNGIEPMTSCLQSRRSPN